MTHGHCIRQGICLFVLCFAIVCSLPALAAETGTRPIPAKDPAAGAARATDRDAVTNTGSYVDHVTRQYSTEGPTIEHRLN